MSRRRSARTERSRRKPTAQGERQREEIKHQRDELAVEKSAVSRTHQLVAQLAVVEDFQSLLREVLDAAIEIQNADFGTLQLYNPETESLEIVAQRGFRRNFLEHFNRVDDRTSACGRAMLTRKRVIIEDVQTDRRFASHRKTADAAGFRAVRGHVLRIQMRAPFRLHWSSSEWRDVRDTSSQVTALGMEFVDISVSTCQQAPIRFTFFWTTSRRWEGRDYTVTVE